MFSKHVHIPVDEKPLSAIFSQPPSSSLAITIMNETDLQALCTSDIFYHTLEDQNSIRTKGGFHLQRKISTTTPTYIHFAVKLDHHWAAVQVTISPFTIRSIPNQTFYTSSYRYALCCSLAVPNIICETVQVIYDVHYRPTQWDFSKLW